MRAAAPTFPAHPGAAAALARSRRLRITLTEFRIELATRGNRDGPPPATDTGDSGLPPRNSKRARTRVRQSTVSGNEPTTTHESASSRHLTRASSSKELGDGNSLGTSESGNTTLQVEDTMAGALRKRKPLWHEAGEHVEPEWLLRDDNIDYNERIQRELASPAEDTFTKIAKARFTAVTRPAPSIPSGSPSASATSLPTGTARSSQISMPLPAKPLDPPFRFGNDAPVPLHPPSRFGGDAPAPRQSPFTFGNDATAPFLSSATAQTSQTSQPPPAKPVVPPFKFGKDVPAPPPRLSTTAPAPTAAAAAAPPKVRPSAKIGPSVSTSVVDPRINPPTAARTVATSAAPAFSGTGFSAYSTPASLVPTASISSISHAPSLCDQARSDERAFADRRRSSAAACEAGSPGPEADSEPGPSPSSDACINIYSYFRSPRSGRTPSLAVERRLLASLPHAKTSQSRPSSCVSSPSLTPMV